MTTVKVFCCGEIHRKEKELEKDIQATIRRYEKKLGECVSVSIAFEPGRPWTKTWFLVAFRKRSSK